MRNRSNYGESLVGTWVLIIGASAIVVALHLNGAAAVIVAFGLVIALAIAGARK